jgi:hydrogenase expression/formation protein HypC
MPMKIVEIDGDIARASIHGIERAVNLLLVQDQDIRVGDYVIVHVGYAIQKLDAAEAVATWQLIEEASNHA